MKSETEKPAVALALGEIATITLDRPEKHNAMTPEMGHAISSAVEQINLDRSVRVVVVRGRGRAFSAGGDFSLIDRNAARTPQENRREMPAFYRSFLSILKLEVPSIAVLHGAAVGAGLCFALACDLRLAARKARLGANFVRVGLHPGMGCSFLLPRLIGPAAAAELILTGRLISGAEAAEIGLVNAAVPKSALDAAVGETVEQIRAAAPLAVRLAKRTLVAPVLDGLDAALEREAECQAEGFASNDLREAVAAFRAGRTPVFHGN